MSNNISSPYLALNYLPKSAQTKFNVPYLQKVGTSENGNNTVLKPYFIGSPMSKNVIRSPLLNSGNGIGAPFQEVNISELVNCSYVYDIENFFNLESYGSQNLFNKTGISTNIDNTIFKNDITFNYKYPSNIFFEIPEDWIFADMYTTSITFTFLLITIQFIKDIWI